MGEYKQFCSNCRYANEELFFFFCSLEGEQKRALDTCNRWMLTLEKEEKHYNSPIKSSTPLPLFYNKVSSAENIIKYFEEFYKNLDRKKRGDE